MTSELMQRIEAFAKREEAVNPKCQQPGECRWDHGVVSCWKCNSLAAGGHITDFTHGLVTGAGRVERDPSAPKANKVKSNGGGKRNEPLEFGSDKWTMYANAIPKPVRAKLAVQGADLRALYKELRALGKDEFLKKHS